MAMKRLSVRGAARLDPQPQSTRSPYLTLLLHILTLLQIMEEDMIRHKTRAEAADVRVPRHGIWLARTEGAPILRRLCSGLCRYPSESLRSPRRPGSWPSRHN